MCCDSFEVCIAVYGKRDVSPVTCVPPVCDVRDVLSVVPGVVCACPTVLAYY